MSVGRSGWILSSLPGIALYQLAVVCVVYAQVSLDGTTMCPQPATLCAARVPPIQVNPVDGEIRIGANLGRTAGNNLFHSFHEFNVATGQTATFSGPAEIVNVISRVTGASPTHIDGLLRTQGMPAAHFFLMNPHGVMFESNASLKVGGSFVVTTADWIDLADNGMFFVSTDPAVSVLATAAPTAFGFLKANPAGVDINQSTLEVSHGQTLSIVGGPVRIVGGTVAEAGHKGGNITIDPNTVVLDASRIIAKAKLGNGGDITIFTDAFVASSDSVIDASSKFGTPGTVVISSPNDDLSRSLVRLPETFADGLSKLLDRCTVKLEDESSSFIVTGRGGMPNEPGGWLPGWHVRGDTDATGD